MSWRKVAVLPPGVPLTGHYQYKSVKQYITGSRSQAQYLVERLGFLTKISLTLEKSTFHKKNLSLFSEKKLWYCF